MPFIVGEVTAPVAADASSFNSTMSKVKDQGEKVSKDISKSFSDIGKKMGDIGKSMTSCVTLPLLGAGAVSFKFAADMQDAIGATQQIFKSASKDMQDWAASLETYYGIAEGEALEYANMMGSMLQNIGGLTEEQAAKQAQTLIELAGDLTAMYGGETQDAVRALTGALKGNNTMLDNYGMAVTDAMIKTKAMEMGIYDGTGQMDLATKQAATLALIMEQTADAQGQAAREADGASGAYRTFKTELKNITTVIGNELLPIITPLIQKVTETVKWFGGLDSSTKKVILTLLGVVAAIGPVLLIGSKLILLVNNIGASMKVLSKVHIGGGVLVALGLLVTAGIYVYKNWDSIKVKLLAIWEVIAASAQNVSIRAQKAWFSLQKGVLEIVQNILSTVSPLINWLPDSMVNGFSRLQEGVANKLSKVQGSLEGLDEAAQENFARVQTALASAATAFTTSTEKTSDATEDMSASIDKSMTKSQKAMKDTGKAAKEMSEEAIEALKKQKEAFIKETDRLYDGLKDSLRDYYDDAREAQEDALQFEIDAVKDATDKKISQYEREYEARIKLLDDEEQASVDALNAQIDAIDAITKEEERALKAQRDAQKIADLKAEILQETDMQRRAELQKKLTEEVAEQERERLLAAREAQKDALRLEIDNIKKQAENRKKALKADLESKKQTETDLLQVTLTRLQEEQSRIKKHYEFLTSEANLNSEAQKMIVENNQKDIVKLLEKYQPDWKNAGKSFGEMLADGILDAMPAIKDAVGSIMSLVNKKSTMVPTTTTSGGGATYTAAWQDHVSGYFGSKEAYAAEIQRKEEAGIPFTDPMAAAAFKQDNPQYFANGGIVAGPIGMPVPAIVHGGEEVLSVAQRNSGYGASTIINVPVKIEGPIYGVLDFDQKVKATVRDAIQGGAFRGLLPV